MRMAILVSLLLIGTPAPASDQSPENFRRPKGDAELRYWLGNMVWHHRFTEAEISAATGLSAEEIRAALAKFGVRPETRPQRPDSSPAESSTWRSVALGTIGLGTVAP